jgi:hypothetical protein
MTGVLDAATWSALNTDSAVTEGLHHHEDLKGPFVPILADMKGKSELTCLGHSSALVRPIRRSR